MLHFIHKLSPAPSQLFFFFFNFASGLTVGVCKLMKLNVFWFCLEVYFVGVSTSQFQSMTLKPKNQSGVKCSIAQSNGKGTS